MQLCNRKKYLEQEQQVLSLDQMSFKLKKKKEVLKKLKQIKANSPLKLYIEIQIVKL